MTPERRAELDRFRDMTVRETLAVFDELKAKLEAAERREKALRAVLEQVQWGGRITSCCPQCLHYFKHAPDCLVSIALALAKEPA